MNRLDEQKQQRRERGVFFEVIAEQDRQYGIVANLHATPEEARRYAMMALEAAATSDQSETCLAAAAAWCIHAAVLARTP